MIVDTSVWINHFRKPSGPLIDALHRADVLMHPWVLHELWTGNLGPERTRRDVLTSLMALASTGEPAPE